MIQLEKKKKKNHSSGNTNELDKNHMWFKCNQQAQTKTYINGMRIESYT